jgi:hypothetical protein
MRNVWRLAAVDGHDEWRRREGEALNTLVDTRIQWLQNPRPNNCSALGALACTIDNVRIFRGEGFACEADRKKWIMASRVSLNYFIFFPLLSSFNL